jgi:pimeloyl-ACP methyl ester carboxylesterase
MKVLFCHGLESGPVGRKSEELRAAGFELLAPDCREKDIAARVAILSEVILQESVPPLVVGSSFGGISGLLATIRVANQGVKVPGLVLLAPALHLPLPKELAGSLKPPVPTILVHGTNDEIIPIEVSRNFAKEHHLELREVIDDHRLAGSLDVMVEVVRLMIEQTSSGA